jgi:thiol-disulfide isomerase/thioredoxin
MAMGRAARLIALAGVLGLAAGVAAVYVSGGGSGNGAAACQAARTASTALAPLARGEVAAFVVERQPVPAPALAFRDRDGREVSLADFRGKTVLLNLWATWCAPCRHEMPSLDRLQATAGGDRFAVVAVSIDIGDTAKPMQFYRETGIERLAFYQDSSGGVFRTLRAAGRAVGMPTTVLIDEAGCIQGHLAGPAEWASPDALALVRAAIGS